MYIIVWNAYYFAKVLYINLIQAEQGNSYFKHFWGKGDLIKIKFYLDGSQLSINLKEISQKLIWRTEKTKEY